MVLLDEDKNLTSVLNSVNNGPLYICDTAFLTALKPDALSTDVHSVLLFTTVMLLVFLPFTILLNILVIVAVNSTHELRTTSNILLACLATTDLLIALTIQPCFIAMEVYFIQGRSVAEFCVLEKVSGIFFYHVLQHISVSYCINKLRKIFGDQTSLFLRELLL